MRRIALLALLFTGMLTLPADAAKRRTFKTTTTKTAPSVSTVPEGEASEAPSAVSATESRPSAQSRSARRRASVPEATDKSNSSVSNSASKSSKSMTTKSTSKSNVHPSTVKEAKKSPLQSIKPFKVDFEKIKAATLDPKNNYYYPKLWERYMDKGSKMTPEEYAYLYLGYMFQEDYDPYRISEFAESVDNMRDKDSYTRAEREELIKNIERSLNDNPFDLRQMSFLVHMLREHDKPNKAEAWERRLEHLLATILSTGTGESKNSPMYVIYPMHEYDVIQLLGYRAVDIDYDNDGYDHLLVEPDGSVNQKKPLKGFYFDVKIPQEQYQLKHPDEYSGADI